LLSNPTRAATEWVFHCGKWVGKDGVVLAEGVLAAAGVEAEVAAGAAAQAGGGGGTGPAEYKLTFYTV